MTEIRCPKRDCEYPCSHIELHNRFEVCIIQCNRHKQICETPQPESVLATQWLYAIQIVCEKHETCDVLDCFHAKPHSRGPGCAFEEDECGECKPIEKKRSKKQIKINMESHLERDLDF